MTEGWSGFEDESSEEEAVATLSMTTIHPDPLRAYADDEDWDDEDEDWDDEDEDDDEEWDEEDLDEEWDEWEEDADA